MFFSLTNRTPDATELGYVLHKNPAHSQSFPLPFGAAQVFYPVANADECTASLLLEIDSIDLVRGAGKARVLDQYVNDRPYVASSFLCVALAKVFRSAMNGQCSARPELVAREYSLEAFLPVVPSRGGAELLPRLFAPLGYEVETRVLSLDENHPEWGASRYAALTLRATKRVQDVLTHLYVLLPVLDDDKHYWVGDDEVEKLLRRGAGWLETHPEKELIARRYLKRPYLARQALAQLAPEESDAETDSLKKDAEELAAEDTLLAQENAGVKVEAVPETSAPDEAKTGEEKSERKTSLHSQRLDAVAQVLKESGAQRVLDLGCGEGRLLQRLLKEKQFAEIVGLDVSHRVLERAQSVLRWERMPEMQKRRIQLWNGALTYRDERLKGFDAAAVVEVIEHLDEARLDAFARVLFGEAAPGLVVVTTPNSEYNVRFPTLPAGKFRHRDHRFEWTRAEFETWGNAVAARFGYEVNFAPLGPLDEEVGAPSQMAIFKKV